MDTLLIINMWLTSVHIYILNDKHINGNSGGHKTIDQSASMLIDDIIASTNEISLSEFKWNLTISCDLSFENILGDKVTFSEVRLQRSMWIYFMTYFCRLSLNTVSGVK